MFFLSWLVLSFLSFYPGPDQGNFLSFYPAQLLSSAPPPSIDKGFIQKKIILLSVPHIMLYSKYGTTNSQESFVQSRKEDTFWAPIGALKIMAWIDIKSQLRLVPGHMAIWTLLYSMGLFGIQTDSLVLFGILLKPWRYILTIVLKVASSSLLAFSTMCICWSLVQAAMGTAVKEWISN